MVIVLALAVVIGLSLGLMGGGGSILAVPVLKYAAGLEAKAAIATSLLVVGTTAAVGGWRHARQGNVAWKTGAIFAVTAMAGAYGGGRAADFFAGETLLMLFALMMLVTSVMMLKGRGDLTPRETDIPILLVVVEGLAVGGLTGLVGAGGGFMVVPALVLLGGMEMHKAVGTSLVVIALKSFAAFAGYVAHVHIDYELAGGVTAAAVAGTLVGAHFAAQVPAQTLRKGFAWFVLLMAGFVLYRESGFAMAAGLTIPAGAWMGWMSRAG